MSDKNPDTFTAKQKEVLVNAGLLANRQPVFLLGLLADVHIEYEELEQRLEEAQGVIKLWLWGEYKGWCPVCKESPLRGHVADCKLDAALRGGEGGEGC